MRRLLTGFLAVLAVVTAALVPGPALAASLPSTPTVAVANSARGTYLTWTASNATAFQVQQATNSAFTQNARAYLDRDGRDRQFTPPHLVKGATYFFRIRGANGSGYGRWSATVRAVAAARTQAVRVMTYNVLVNLADGEQVGNERIAAWSERAAAEVTLIRQGNPDLIAVQEGAGWVAEVKGPRQVDDLVTRLGGTYALARTEPVPGTEPGWYRTGRYILYKPATYAPLGTGGHWNIGDSRWAAYQAFTNRATGARFLLISAHLVPGRGSSFDTSRQTETKTVMAFARDKAAALGGIPVVLAGDMNSNDGSNYTFDGPGVATRAARVADAFKVAATRANWHVNSAHQYLRNPPLFGRSIDRVFVSPGIGVRSWRLLATMSGTALVAVIPSDHNPVQVDLAYPY